MSENITIARHRRMVEEAGGDYVCSKVFGNLVMFNSRETGSTLCLPEKKVTVDAIRRHIAESNAKFAQGRRK